MHTPRLTSIATVAIGAAVLGIGSVATTATAAAGSADDAFITRMTALGISFTSPQAGIRAGHHVCTELAAGKTMTDVAVDVRDQTSLTSKQAAYFVVDASNVYCPSLAEHLA
ncbi:MAG TPA: DUF732 domain-containing protein [Mycobacterium sp.]